MYSLGWTYSPIFWRRVWYEMNFFWNAVENCKMAMSAMSFHRKPRKEAMSWQPFEHLLRNPRIRSDFNTAPETWVTLTWHVWKRLKNFAIFIFLHINKAHGTKNVLSSTVKSDSWHCRRPWRNQCTKHAPDTPSASPVTINLLKRETLAH